MPRRLVCALVAVLLLLALGAQAFEVLDLEAPFPRHDGSRQRREINAWDDTDPLVRQYGPLRVRLDPSGT